MIRKETGGGGRKGHDRERELSKVPIEMAELVFRRRRVSTRSGMACIPCLGLAPQPRGRRD